MKATPLDASSILICHFNIWWNPSCNTHTLVSSRQRRSSDIQCVKLKPAAKTDTNEFKINDTHTQHLIIVRVKTHTHTHSERWGKNSEPQASNINQICDRVMTCVTWTHTHTGDLYISLYISDKNSIIRWCGKWLCWSGNTTFHSQRFSS